MLIKRHKLKTKSKIISDTTSFNLHVNSKSNKSFDVKFIIAISKNPEPLSLQKLTLLFPIKIPFHKILKVHLSPILPTSSGTGE